MTDANIAVSALTAADHVFVGLCTVGAAIISRINVRGAIKALAARMTRVEKRLGITASPQPEE